MSVMSMSAMVVPSVHARMCVGLGCAGKAPSRTVTRKVLYNKHYVVVTRALASSDRVDRPKGARAKRLPSVMAGGSLPATTQRHLQPGDRLLDCCG